MIILRATARVLAATTGLLLVYGIIFILEGITDRIPTAAIRELVLSSLYMTPWLLLFCSGLHDFAVVTRRSSLLWIGSMAILLLLYYLDHYTSLTILTKVAMPPIALGLGLVPHFLKKVGFLFATASLAAGIAGVWILCDTFLSPTRHFGNPLVMASQAAFCVSGIISGVLVILDICRSLTKRFAT